MQTHYITFPVHHFYQLQIPPNPFNYPYDVFFVLQYPTQLFKLNRKDETCKLDVKYS